jgi:phage gpG-like protein
MDLTLKVEYAENLLKNFDRLKKAMDNPIDLKKKLAEYLQFETQERFATETDPWGQAWKPSKRVLNLRTGGAKMGEGGGRTLWEYGNLRGSFGIDTEGQNIVFGQRSNLVYFAIHQWGGQIHMPARTHTLNYKKSKSGKIGNKWVKKAKSNFSKEVSIAAYTINMPARPILPIKGNDVVLPPGYETAMRDIVKKWGESVLTK